MQDSLLSRFDLLFIVLDQVKKKLSHLYIHFFMPSFLSSTHIIPCTALFYCNIKMDPDNDRQISEHVLRMHRYRTPGEQDGEGKLCILHCRGPNMF